MRHLRPSQVAWRVRLAAARRREVRRPERLRQRLARRMAGSRLIDARPGFALRWPAPGDAPARLAELERGELTLARTTRPFTLEADDPWRLGDPGKAHRLWTHQLHYHLWLIDLAPAADDPATGPGHVLAHHLNDWLERCPPGAAGFNVFAWNSYAIATRLTAWAQLLTLLPEAFWRHYHILRDRLGHSLLQQAAYLETHLERDLCANHLLRDVVGLAVAGRVTEGPAAERWRRLAERMARQQLAEQVLADGGHYERSPMYHVQAMQDVHSLARLVTDEGLGRELAAAYERMRDWLAWMRHPSGHYPLLNDANETGALCPGEVLAVGGREASAGGGADTDKAADGLVSGTHGAKVAPPAGRHFEDSGYIVWHGRTWSVFFDAAPIGPDHQPGHGHADTLTLEASYGGERLIVDPGTGSYDLDATRHYDRSTAAHNTVVIDGTDSSEVWHIFRVGRRARPGDVQVALSGTGLEASARHDGYRHLPGKPTHRRGVRVVEYTLSLHDALPI